MVQKLLFKTVECLRNHSPILKKTKDLDGVASPNHGLDLVITMTNRFVPIHISLGTGYHQVSSHSNVVAMIIVGDSSKKSSWPNAQCFSVSFLNSY